MAQMACRRLKLQDPRIVKRYNKRLKEHMEEHKIVEKLSDLNQQISGPLTKEQQETYEKLDRLIIEGKTMAEKKCRKLHKGEVPFSPQVNQFGAMIQFWRLVRRQSLRQKHSSQQLERLRRKLDIRPPLPTSLSEIEELIQLAWRNYKHSKKQATAERTSFLDDLAQARAEESLQRSNKSKEELTESQLRNMISNERLRESFRRIKASRGVTKQGLSTVVTTDENGNEITLTKQKEIEESIMAENVKKFTQTHNTTPLSHPLLSFLGHTGDKPEVTSILNGTFEGLKDLSPIANQFLSSLKKPEHIPQLDKSISTEEWRLAWKKAKERTSSGQSGIHFGHYKASAQDNTLLAIDVSMASIPFSTGYSPIRWRTAVNVMIPKKVNSPHVTQLRTITLYEADFNMTNKILSKRTMAHAEKYGLLAIEQEGGRKHRKAIHHSINKSLLYSISTQGNWPALVVSTDAKSCYDRIAHPTLSIILQSMGVPLEPILCQYNTIQRTKHYVRTSFGDSEQYYDGDEWAKTLGKTFQGVGQGNGFGPTAFTCISSKVMNFLRENDFGVHLQTPLDKQQTNFVGTYFVDDNELMMLENINERSTKNRIKKMQDMVSLYSTVMELTGAALVPRKSYWASTHKPQPEDCYEEEITIPDLEGKEIPLEKISLSEARELLGVWIAPNQNQNKQFTVLLEKAKQWAHEVRGSSLEKEDVWRSLHTTILKSLQYPLPAAMLSKKQCNAIMSPLLLAGLPKMKIARTFPREVIHGPYSRGGFGIPDLYTTQNISKIEILLDQFDKQSITSSLLQLHLQYLTLEIGIGDDFLLKSFDVYGRIITPSIITSLWQFTTESNIQIHLPLPTTPLMRQKDTYIMEEIGKRKLSLGTLKDINQCRMFLQVISVSDISSACGTRLLNQCLEGIKPSWLRAIHPWPDIKRPGPKAWTTWRETLISTFGHKTTTLLSIPLGNWITRPERWQWFYSP